MLSPDRVETIRRRLLLWYRAEARDLPWRRTGDPYAIWVSESMLQQTQVATVIPYYERWMRRFPTLRALAEAEEEDVLRAWEGLGYYSRARNLLRGAREVVLRHGGTVPDRVEDLLQLPGVGPYTAGAIASIAYNRPVPIVDGNVVRVLTRLFALRGDPGRAPLKRELWNLAGALVPEGDARDFNSALMELGATVCSPANPACGRCPLAPACLAREAGIQPELPETPARPKVTAVHSAAALAWREGRVLLVQRSARASRWPGMWEFPNAEVAAGETAPAAASRALAQQAGLTATPLGVTLVVRHAVTRYRITLEAYDCGEAAGEPAARACQAHRWTEVDRLEAYAMPAAHRKIARHLAGAGR